jgi:hypothetical protein
MLSHDGHSAGPALPRRKLMETRMGRLITSVACAALLAGTTPAPLFAQGPPPPPPQQGGDQQGYSAEQLDALLAPIALYPDQLLTQVLMAASFPDQCQAASTWLNDQGNAQLRGDQLSQALVPLPWDPSVKSLVPFPQVLTMMNQQPDWLQQLGYAMSVQQPAVMDSVQRLRKQAQIAGQLQSSEHQVVSTEGSSIVIQPAQPDVVYVPTYNPVDVYGDWPYPAYPPFYLPPPPGYYGDALLGGLAFGAGIAITAGLWGWARPNWGGRNVFINVNNYNRWSPGRPWRGGNAWHPYRPVGRPGWGYRAPAARFHPPGGYRPAGFHPGVRPGPGVRPPPFHAPGVRPGGGYRPPGSHPGELGRPGTRPAVTHPGNVTRPATRPEGNVSHPGTRPGARPGERPGTRPGGAAEAGHRAPPPHRTQDARPSPGPRPGGAGGFERPAARPPGGGFGGGRPPGGGGARPAPAPRPAPAAHPGGGEHRH